MSARDFEPQHLLAPLPSATLGELLALVDNGSTPLALHPGHPEAVHARSTIDLHGAHVGGQVLLVFEHGDPRRPIVTGVLRQSADLRDPVAGQVEVDTDGQRMVMSAREQLVLRCGKASITLTQAGKVVIDGTYVLSRSTGVNRLKGGSVQMN